MKTILQLIIEKKMLLCVRKLVLVLQKRKEKTSRTPLEFGRYVLITKIFALLYQFYANICKLLHYLITIN